MKILTIIGARPQFIKAAPFSDVFRKNQTEILVHTGQHYDLNMSEIFFDELKIPRPDYNLNIGSGNHGEQTAKMLMGIEEIIFKESPDGVLVYGDTNSTLAGALAASKLHIPVFHVEAGLRSYNKFMPEEQNRILTDHLSDLLLCPTKTAILNLEKEGINEGVVNTGDIMYDAVLRNWKISNEKYASNKWIKELRVLNETDKRLENNGYYLATIHRAENTDKIEKLSVIFSALEDLDKPVLMPIHPRTNKKINELKLKFKNIILVEPVGYLLMLTLISNSKMIITDSGGLQKESYFLDIPCTTLRDQTEWIETLKGGWNILSDINKMSIIKHVTRDTISLKKDGEMFFGDGKAAMKISEAVIEKLTKGGK